MSALGDILTRDGFSAAWLRAVALPGEPHWDEDLSIPCERPPSGVVRLCDPIHQLGEDAE